MWHNTNKNKWTNESHDQIAITDLIAGWGQFIKEYMDDGYTAVMITFMFRFNRNDPSLHLAQMRDEVNRVYAKFITEVVRNPNSEFGRNNRPLLFACPDWPVYKRRAKSAGASYLAGEGVHCAGVLLVPPINRLRHGIKDHFECSKRDNYVVPGKPLSRIHIKSLEETPGKVADYVLKSIKRKRCTPDDIIILPFSQSEI